MRPIDTDTRTPLAFITSSDGGLAHYVAHLWPHAARRYRPHYITYADKPPDDLVARHVARVERLVDFKRPESAEAVRRLIADEGVALVNIHVATTAKRNAPYYTSLLGALRADGVRVVETLHDVMPFATFRVDMDEVRALYAEADAYLVGSERQRQQLLANYDVGHRPVAIAPHGPYDLFNQNLYDRDSARRLCGIPPEAPTVLFFGRLRPDKSLRCLLDAFPLARARLPEAVLFISTDTSYTPQYDAELEELKHAGRERGIVVRREYVPSDMIEAIFKAADVLALPYENVSQSGVLNLGKAFYKPAIVTNIFDQTDEIARHWGRVVPVNDATALADAMVELLSLSDAERRAMGETAMRLANEKYSWEINARALFDMDDATARG